MAPHATRHVNLDVSDSMYKLFPRPESQIKELAFRTSCMRLSDLALIHNDESKPPYLALDLPFCVFHDYPGGRHDLTAELRTLSASTPRHLDIIVIHASPTFQDPFAGGRGWAYYHEKGEEESSENGWYSSNRPDDGVEESWLTLMAIAWDKPDEDVSMSTPRRATRIGIISSLRGNGEGRVLFPITATAWMGMDSRPREVEVILH